MTAFAHQPVLLEEVVALLQPAPGKVMLDGTAGGGGHAEALAEAGAKVVALDRDPAGVEATRARLARYQGCWVVQSDYAKAVAVVASLGLSPLDGALLDLGVSSVQFDRPERGFSFRAEGPLDMRMGPDGETARELLARLDDASSRRSSPTWERNRSTVPSPGRSSRHRAWRPRWISWPPSSGPCPRRAWPKQIHVATKTFQAIRLAVNHELESLESIPAGSCRACSPRWGGRRSSASTRSRTGWSSGASSSCQGACHCPPGLPTCVCGAKATFRLLTRKAIKAGDAEVAANPRARSARLRSVEKLQEAA